jgi:hypothetical protein
LGKPGKSGKRKGWNSFFWNLQEGLFLSRSLNIFGKYWAISDYGIIGLVGQKRTEPN